MDLIIVSGISFVVVFAAFLILVNTSHTSIIDFVWCFGVTASSIFYVIYLEGQITTFGWHIIVLQLLWFARLGGMILFRTLALDEEDGRYRRLAERWESITAETYLNSIYSNGEGSYYSLYQCGRR